MILVEENFYYLLSSHMIKPQQQNVMGQMWNCAKKFYCR